MIEQMNKWIGGMGVMAAMAAAASLVSLAEAAESPDSNEKGAGVALKEDGYRAANFVVG